MKVAYLGPPGTNGEEAAIRAAPDAERLPCTSHAEVAKAVDSGRADIGVVAIENLLTGSVAETLDILIHETSLRIQAELLVPIVHNLVVRPGTKLEDICVVYSHTQALGQCRKFLETRLPHAAVEASLSTAGAVDVAMKHGGDAAAIATARAAALFGGEVLVPGIGDSANNVTRFVVLSAGRRPPSGHDVTAIAFWFANDSPGSLAGVLDEFAIRGINCRKIESRPTRETFGEYVFLVDFEAHEDDPLGAAVLAAIRPLCSSVKVFGSYPSGV
ncbi:MAG: prephenate dehydratase [Chloroflexi bacterium]|nr:prephenate dehydratase [Chloroflexota bacterium]